MTDQAGPVTAVQTFAQAGGGETFDILYDIPEPLPPSAALILSVATMTTGKNTADYELTARLGDAPFVAAGAATHTTSKRRHRLGLFVLPVSASGPVSIRVEAGREVSSMAAVIGIVEGVDPANPLVADVNAVGNQTAINASLPLTAEAGAVLVAAQTRRGSSALAPGDGLTLLAAVSPNPQDVDNLEVATALAYQEPDTAQAAAQVGMTGSQAGVTALVAAALRKAAEPEPEPEPEPRPEEFVIVRDLKPGTHIIVRVVQLKDIRTGEGGAIDWAKTPHTTTTVYVPPAVDEGEED